MNDNTAPPSARPSGSAGGALVGGKYQIIEPLKRGGTAMIELAIMRGENNFTREVVLKRPLPHLLADKQLRAMFLDEAHLASRFSHPNVVQVIDLVAREDEVFLVLEHLRGRDLRELIKRSNELGKLIPQDITAYIIAESAAGLGYAHDARTPDGQALNLVHRDVSPKNVRITDEGAVKVIDFGIARADVRQTETAPGSVKGTLGYMSPEQVLGEVVDRRSDVFSLGICLYQMLTGRNPFDGANLKERVARLIHRPIPNAIEIVPELDPRLEAIARRALERDIDARYQDMTALREDLEEYLADQRRASPRQRLVTFLESIFPDIHRMTPRLQEALSTSSSLSGRGGALLVDAAREAQAMAATHQVAPASPLEARPPTLLVTSQPPVAAREVNSSWADPPVSVPPEAKGPGASELATETERPAEKPVKGALIAIAVSAFVGCALAMAWAIAPRGGSSSDIPGASEPRITASAPPVASASPAASVVASPLPSPAETPLASPAETPLASPAATPLASPAAAPPTADPVASAGPSPTPARPKTPKHAPRDLLRAGAKLARAGQLDDAELLYRLAYARSGGAIDPAIYKNLGLVHRDQGDVAKLRACFNMYLSRSGGGDDAQKIRVILAGFPAAPSVPCVSPAEAAAAEKIAQRMGARIEGWIATP